MLGLSVAPFVIPSPYRHPELVSASRADNHTGCMMPLWILKQVQDDGGGFRMTEKGSCITANYRILTKAGTQGGEWNRCYLLLWTPAFAGVRAYHSTHFPSTSALKCPVFVQVSAPSLE